MLKFNVDGQKLTRENRPTVAADSIGYLTAQFTFSSEWDGLSKIVAVFEKGVEKQARILTDGYILEEDNLSLSKGTWLVSVAGYAYEGETVTKQVTTTTETVDVEKTLTDADGNPLPSITPSYEAQILAIAENALSVYTTYDLLVSYIKGRRVTWDGSSYAWINDEASVAGTSPENEYPVTGWLCIARKGEAVSGTTMDLVWTNASPTSSFTGGSEMSMDLSDYDMVLIEFLYSTTSARMCAPLFINKGSVGFGSAPGVYIVTRNIDGVTNTGITFANGVKYTTYTTGSSNNTVLIPYKVWGIKNVG